MDIVIPTCDAYVGAVPLAEKTLQRYLPEFPLQVVYTLEKPETGRASLTKLWRDRQWIANMYDYLFVFGGSAPFILWLDDYMAVDVDREMLDEALAAMIEGVAMVRLVPTPGPTLPGPSANVGTIDKTAEYSLSLQASIWRPSALLRVCENLLELGCKTAWDFEITGSKHASAFGVGKFLGCRKCAVSYDNLYRRGRMVSAVVERLVASGTIS
jgi:hypothetical protein